MPDHHKTNLRSLSLAAAVFAVTLCALLGALQLPARVSAQPAAQATATVPITATTTISPTAGTFTNACGVVISNEVISPSVEVTPTEVIVAEVVTSTVIAEPPPTVASTPTPTPAAGVVSPTVQVLRIGEDIFPATLDPQSASFVNEFEILNLAYEGLVRVDAQGNIEPGAAEKFEFNPDGTRLTFTLRPDLKRVDDTPITSRDFAAAIKRGLDPCLGGRDYAAVLYDIKGAQAVSELDVDTHTQADLQAAMEAVGILTPDDRTLVFEFNQPVGDYWVYQTSLPIFFPTDIENAATSPDGWAQLPGDHNGNGPFILYDMVPESSITLVANPNYWRGKPKLDRIEFKYNPDAQAQLDAYKRGELDLDANVTAELVPQIVSDTLAADLHQYEGAQTYALAFNNSLKPFDDRIVRTAFSQALDREGFVRDILLGAGEATTRWIPAGVPGNQADQPGVPASDPQAAVKTLVENGYGTADGKVDCAQLGEIKFTYPDSPTNKQRAEYIAANLENVFGCEIALDPVNPIEFTQLTRSVKTNPQLSLQRWVEDFPHPQNWLSAYWTCGSFARQFGYCNLFLDELLKKADSTTDLEAALTQYQQAENLLITDVPGAFMFNPHNLHLVKPYVIGPQDNESARDAGWLGEWGPVWNYEIDLTQVPATYPRQ